MRKRLLYEKNWWSKVLDWLVDQVWPPQFPFGPDFWGNEGVKPPTAGEIKTLKQFRKSGQDTPPSNVLKILTKYKNVDRKAKSKNIKENKMKRSLKNIIKEELNKIKNSKSQINESPAGWIESWCECGCNDCGCYGRARLSDDGHESDCRCCQRECCTTDDRMHVSRDLREQHMPNPAFRGRMKELVLTQGCTALMNKGNFIAAKIGPSKGGRWNSMLRNKIVIIRKIGEEAGCGSMPLNV
jgi:hypothetical protein